MGLFADGPAKSSGTRHTLKKPQDMSGHVIQTNPFNHLFLAVSNKAFHNHFARGCSPRSAVNALVHVRQQVGIAVDLPSEHHAINVSQQGFALFQRRNTAIDDDFQRREFTFQVENLVILQGGGFPDFPWD